MSDVVKVIEVLFDHSLFNSTRHESTSEGLGH